MSLYKKDIAKAIIVMSLVAVLSIGSYFLFPDVLPKMVYAVGATIQDDALATEDFIAETLKSGGVCSSIVVRPWITLMFENGTEYRFFMTCRPDCNWARVPIGINLMDWLLQKIPGKQLEIDASGLQRFNISWGEGWTLAHSESQNSSRSEHCGSPGGSFPNEREK